MKEISLYNLELLANSFGIRIWLCQKKGNRWAFIRGAGEQLLLPSELVWQKDDLGIFVQGDGYNKVDLLTQIESLQTAIS